MGRALSLIAHADGPRGELVLRRRTDGDGRDVLELRANGIFVMDTAEVSTERALAAEVLTQHERPAQVLIGGLGLGYTLSEVLVDPRVRSCAVVEVEEALVAWMRDGTVPHGPGILGDRRVEVVVADIGEFIAQAAPATYDLVLLDVDNGPGYLVHQSNQDLYGAPFLHEVRRVLTPAGMLAVWSADVAPALQESLQDVFEVVEARALPVRLQGRDEEYWVYLAHR